VQFIANDDEQLIFLVNGRAIVRAEQLFIAHNECLMATCPVRRHACQNSKNEKYSAQMTPIFSNAEFLSV